MNAIYFVSQLITFFRKTEKQNDRTAWVQWREVVQEIYRETLFQNKLKLIINSGTADASKFKTILDIQIAFAALDEDNKKEVVELLVLYLELIKKEKDLISASHFEIAIHEITSGLVEITNQEIQNKVSKWLADKAEDKFYFKIKLEGTLFLILLDIFLRWVSLWNFKTNAFDTNQFMNPLAFLSLSQLILIPVTILIFGIVRDRKIIKKTQQIFEKINRTDLKIINKHSPWNYLITFLCLIFGMIITIISLDVEQADRTLISIIVFFIYGSYLLWVLTFLSKKLPSVSGIMIQLEKINLNQVKTNLNHRDNDEEIIELEVNLRSSNDKMEAYVLEAALFGALAFSGFLQLISSSNVSLESLELFSSHIYSSIYNLVNFTENSNLESLNFLLSKDGILSLMAFQTLFCSVFFLAVIASRLRFNDLSDSIDRSLQLSKTYNDKEENVLANNDGTPNESSNFFTKLIRKHLIQGNLSLEQTIPIMEFMRFFRTLGIFTFFVIVVSGGLFISVQLSLVLAFIMLISFLFFKLSNILQYVKNITTQFQEFYFKIEKRVIYFIYASLTLCFALRTFWFDNKFVSALILFSFLVIFIHFLLSLFIPERLEDSEISQSVFVSGNTGKIVLKKLFKIALAVLFLGLMFKISSWPFANLLVMIGTLLMTFYFIASQKTTNNQRSLSFIFRMVFAISIFGGMFFIMHWPGANIIRYLSIIGIIVIFILSIIYKNHLLKTTKNITIGLLILGFALQFPFLRFALTTLSFNYPIYQEKMKVGTIIGKLVNSDNGFIYAKTKPEIDSLKLYLSKTDKIINSIHPHDLNEYCNLILENQQDTTILAHALTWSIAIIKQDPYITHYLTNIELLIKLKKYQLGLRQISIFEKRFTNNAENKDQFFELESFKKTCIKNLGVSN